MAQKKIPLLVIAGPTASGKTRLAIELAKAFHGEVVSADSMQIYRHMKIATAKPTKEEMDGIPHHLLDFLDPDDAAFSVADYTHLAQAAIAEITERGKLPVLCGGTGLYIQSVIDNLDFDGFSGDPEIRQRLQKDVEDLGSETMWKRLAEADPELAQKLHPNNLGRILRALEVYEATGIPMSIHQQRAKSKPSPYQLCMLGLRYQKRELLYERINQRVDRMLEQGLLQEAQKIISVYGGTACQAIGYKELLPYLQGESPLGPCIEKLKQATRNYAKRQLCWFGRDKRIQWICVDEYENPHELFTDAQILVHKSGII